MRGFGSKYFYRVPIHTCCTKMRSMLHLIIFRRPYLSVSMFFTDAKYLVPTVFSISSLESHLNSVSPKTLPPRLACPAMMRAFMKKTFSPTSSAFLLLLVMALGKLDE